MSQVDSQQLRQRLHKLSVRSAQLQGIRIADAERRDVLTGEVSSAKARLNLGEEIGRIFDALHQCAHERSVGAFERLLTAILQDVLPEEGSVRLLPQFKRNGTWLDIMLEKGGELEDVVDGNGGAVTNVVCAGLRFAALSRTRNRRLMVLDEPDCWLKPERVPAFVRVVAQVSAQTKTQTFFITHHDPAFFEGNVNLVRFYADETGKVHAQGLAPQLTQWESDDEPGLRSIELINLRRHEHTVIPCYPGPTAFIGDNNLGKSTAIVTSFKALAYGESDASMIRHGCTEAKIIFHLEKGRRIEWSLSTKRSPSILYQLFEAGSSDPVMEGRPKVRNQAPEWVTDVLGIQRVDDLDIQVGNQKSPVFLLNDSGPKRAQILSIGREASHLKTLMKRYEGVKSSDRETVKHGEAQLSKLNYRLARLEALDSADEILAELLIESEDMFSALEKRERLHECLQKVERMLASVAVLQLESAAMAVLPDTPTLYEVDKLDTLAKQIDKSTRRLHIADVPSLPDEPKLAEVATLCALATQIETSARRVQVSTIPALPETPALMEIAGIAQAGQSISRLTKSVGVLEGLPRVVPAAPDLAELEALKELMAKVVEKAKVVDEGQRELAQVHADFTKAHEKMEALKEEMGGVCPLCNAPFPMTTPEIAAHAHIH